MKLTFILEFLINGVISRKRDNKANLFIF